MRVVGFSDSGGQDRDWKESGSLQMAWASSQAPPPQCVAQEFMSPPPQKTFEKFEKRTWAGKGESWTPPSWKHVNLTFIWPTPHPALVHHWVWTKSGVPYFHCATTSVWLRVLWLFETNVFPRLWQLSVHRGDNEVWYWLHEKIAGSSLTPPPHCNSGSDAVICQNQVFWKRYITIINFFKVQVQLLLERLKILLSNKKKIVILLCFFFTLLVIVPRALHMQARCLTTELQILPFIKNVFSKQGLTM